MIQIVSLRMVRERSIPCGIRRSIGKPAAVAELWFDLHPHGEPDREQVWLVCLDTRNQGLLQHKPSAPFARQELTDSRPHRTAA